MNTTSLAFEIGVEEIPAFDLAGATKQLPKIAEGLLKDADISYKEIAVYSTPRRLIVLVDKIATETNHIHEEYRGPSAAIAFDDEGNPTKAAIGFAKGKGLDVSNLERRSVDGVEYLYAVKETPPRNTQDILPDLLLALIQDISWPKSCKWGTQQEWFSRPVRWLLALLGDRIIPVQYAGLEAGSRTYGHRFLKPGPHTITSADQLIGVLEQAFVVPSEALRKERIEAEVATLEAELGLTCRMPERTLTEVINLTEYPTALSGMFDEEFLAVPEEIIVDAMLVHQRYFPLYDQAGNLTNTFIVIMNGNPEYKENITEGNERVVRPRLADAKFFYEEDLKSPLEAYVDRLDEVIFQETLGTMKDKTDRIMALVEHISTDAGLTDADKKDALRAAFLCKADLVTSAVIEFTSVQGIMGSYYAEAAGESPHVAEAIAQHYRPRFAGDEPPTSAVGKLVAFADKLDTICGLIAADQAPTGSSDPFALRRSAIGITSMLLQGLPISLEQAIQHSFDTLKALSFDREHVSKAVHAFFAARLKNILRDKGHELDTVEAVMACGSIEPCDIEARVQALEDARKLNPEVMEDLAVAYNRAHNLSDASLGTEVVPDLMGSAESALYEALCTAADRVKKSTDTQSYSQALKDLAVLRDPIDRFFEDVLIMDKDEKLKENRLKLLNRFVAVFASVADFGLLVKQK